ELNGALRLRQQRFSFDGTAVDGQWAVPVRVRQWSGDAQDDRWVLLDEDETLVPLVAPDATVVVNAGADGFFRVTYSVGLLGRLTGEALESLAPAAGYALVDDAWAWVVAGTLRADEFCQFARSFAAEDRLEVWQVLLAGLRWCGRFLEDEPRE